MNKRRSEQSRTNDGLPTVKGKKVQRRSVGLANSVFRERHSKENDKDGSFFCTVLEYILLFTSILAVASLFWKGDKPLLGGKNAATVAGATTEVGLVKAQESAPILKFTRSAGEFPSVCTSEQKDLIKKQLPNSRGCDVSYMECSSTAATVASGFAHNPILMREFYASDNFKLDSEKHYFFAVVLQWQNNDVPLDILQIGSRENKCNVNDWNTKLGVEPNQALPHFEIPTDGTKRKASVMVVNWPLDTKTQPKISLSQLKADCGYSDDEFKIETFDANLVREGAEDALTKLIRSEMPSKQAEFPQPIHYLEMQGGQGEDYNLLKNLLPGLLKDVRYVHFNSNKVGSWQVGPPSKLKALVEMMKHSGLVCYWAGKKEADHGLWRITDCWLEHFNVDHWGSVSCVNFKHDDVKELADRMEQKFFDTIQKNHVFRGTD